MKLVLNMPKTEKIASTELALSAAGLFPVGENMISIAAGTLESVLPVQIEDDQLRRDYEHTLFPRGNKLKQARVRKGEEAAPDSFKASKLHYYQALTYLFDVSRAVTEIQSRIRYIYWNVPRWQAENRSKTEMKESLLRTFSGDVKKAKISETIVAGQKVDKDPTEGDDSPLKGINAINSGRTHIIVPSTRYKDGYDIIFSGVPGNNYGDTSITFSSTYGKKELLPNEKNAYALSKESVIANKICTQMAEEVHKFVYGSKGMPDIGKPYVRDVKQIPLKPYKFNELLVKLDKLAASTGILTEFGELDTKPAWPTGLEAISKFFSFLVVKEPNMTAIRSKNSRPAAEDDELDIAMDLQQLFQPEFAFSLAMNLPKELVSFITQTKIGGKIPLMSLNTWVNVWVRSLIRIPRARKSAGDVTVRGTPRYVILPSRTGELEQRRKELDLYTEPGRCNEDHIFVSDKGRFNYCPPADKAAFENAKNYEALQEEALRVSFEAGSPLIASQIGATSPYFASVSGEYKTKIANLKSNILQYGGSLQTYSWDYNVILTSSKASPDRLIAFPLAGAIRPDDLALTDYLKKPISDALRIMFPQSKDEEGNALDEKHYESATGVVNNSIITSLLSLYEYLLYAGKAPDLQTLVTSAAKELNITTLDPSQIKEDDPGEYDLNIYGAAIFGDDLKVRGGFINKPTAGVKYVKGDPASEQAIKEQKDNKKAQSQAIKTLLSFAIADASSKSGSNLARISAREGTVPMESNRFFLPNVSTMADFKNLYNYLGGMVFKKLLEAIRTTDRKNFMVVDINNPMDLPVYANIVTEVMPFVTFFSKYVPDSEAITQRGEEAAEALLPDNSITVDDIHLPGSRKGFQMFPHQVEANKTLCKHPRFAVLDVAPGGGKTILLVTDIGGLVHAGKINRPAVVCPNGLVKNYLEDLHSVTEGRWNIIPLTTLTYKTWGDERLTNLIKTAPINTIFVIGLSFLRLQQYQVVIGNHAESVSATLEFCKKFGIDYVAFDESHKGKNTNSKQHKSVKQLCVASSVKYVRLATGTLFQTRLTDVVGQAALLGSHIFRTKEEYIDENSEQVGSSRVTVLSKDTPYRARRQLGRYAAVISAKKKEWAFLLPRPIETFMAVPLDGSDPENNIDDVYGSAHQLMYDAVLTSVLDQIKQDKSVMSLLSGKEESDDGADEDGDDDEDEGENEGIESATGNIAGLPIGGTDDMDDATLDELAAALQPYIQRLEMMLTDPLGDAFGETYFKALKKENYVSRKVLKVIERAKLNFTESPWKKGNTYQLKDVADFNGTRYVLLGKPGEKLTLDSYNETYTSSVDPNKDPRWKPEPMGKVIIFCRYTRSVNAIYRAMPAALKKLCVKFSGEEKDKWENLERFRLSPFSTEKGAQILIANEQAISEGHNLQMASRIVRVEMPWGPGELDQSSSRIFRPDTTGKFRRENIYLDWVMCNHTLEVAKVGRLISRMVEKAKFDETDNPLYQPLEETNLQPIRMTMETIQATPRLEDISEYINTYGDLVRIQSAEFEELRQTRPSTMFDIEETPMPKGSRILEQVPYIPTVKSVPDRHNYGLTKLSAWLENSDDEEVAEVLGDKEKLKGMYVHTEFGNGVIESVRVVKAKDDPEKFSRLSRVTVRLANGDEYSTDATLVYLARNVTKDNVKDFTPKNRWATQKDKTKADKEKVLLDKQEQRERARLEKQAIRELKQLQRLKLLKAKQGKAGGTKVAKPVTKSKPVTGDADETTLELYPVIYNGYLALEATPGEDDEKDMKKLGFKNFGQYVYVQLTDLRSAEAIIAYLKSKYYLRSETSKKLDRLLDAFNTGRGRKFNIELAPLNEFKNFYNISHKLSGVDKASSKPELKVYPVIIDGALVLNIDLSTNPVSRKLVGKTIPGSKLKFALADGLWIQFFKSHAQVVSWVKGIKADGIKIMNAQEFTTRMEDLKDKLKFIQKLAK